MRPFLHRTSLTVMKMSRVHYSGNSEGRTLWPGKMNVCATILDSENMNLATPNVPNKAKSMVGAGCCLTGKCRGYSTTRSALYGWHGPVREKTPTEILPAKHGKRIGEEARSAGQRAI